MVLSLDAHGLEKWFGHVDAHAPSPMPPSRYLHSKGPAGASGQRLGLATLCGVSRPLNMEGPMYIWDSIGRFLKTVENR